MEKLSESGFCILKSIVEKMEKDYVKLDSERGFIPLVAENVDSCVIGEISFDQISLAHYTKCNGDLMADPEMIFLFNGDLQLAIPFYFKNDYAAIEQYSILIGSSKCASNMQKGHVEFAEMWMRNIKGQQDL